MKKPNLPSSSDRLLRSIEGNVRPEPETTGRFLVAFREGAIDEGRKLLEAAGFILASADDVSEGVLREDQAEAADVLLFPRVDMALLSGDPGQYERVKSLDADVDPQSPIISVVPEQVVYSASDGPVRLATYLHGYSDGVRRAAEHLLTVQPNLSLRSDRENEINFQEDNFTWGLQATKVHSSKFAGSGVRIAVLDTGIDLNHQDFNGRLSAQRNQSFIWGVTSVQDGNGHGTHCAGIACGPRRPVTGPRYGVAPDAAIFIGKVLNDAKLGVEGWIVAGVDWAIKNHCDVVSMSVEQNVGSGVGFNLNYENVARRALDNSVLVIAAAGNNSNRSISSISPVSAPANCPSIIAVGSVGILGQEFKVSNFSNGGIHPNGGEVDIAAPGESIHSSFPPNTYRRDSGTSMATPFVAGIAALLAQSDASARGRTLGRLLVGSALDINARREDAGSGLIQAPR